jgi:uncharacterized protein (DUF608 family)
MDQPNGDPFDRPIRTFSGGDLLQIAMPMGGIGAGCICLSGNGGFQDYAIYGRPRTSAMHDGHSPREGMFALIHIRGDSDRASITRLVEGPLAKEKVYDQGLMGQGYRASFHAGLPRFREAAFESAYPFGRARLTDAKLPVAVDVTGWSPFIPNDDRNSSLPCAIIEYTIRNVSDRPIEVDFSFNALHAAVGTGKWKKTRNAVIPGFGAHLYNAEPPADATFGGCAIGIIGHAPVIKAQWFRGGWFDPIAALWREVSTGSFTANDGNTSNDIDGYNGASVMTSLRLAPGESITVPVVVTWYFPNRSDRVSCETDPNATEPCCEPDAPAWQPYYAGQWKDAVDVANYVRNEFAALRGRTVSFQRALAATTMPIEAIDAVTSNLAILKSPTVLRQANGNVWAWEGCWPDTGCCSGTCTHVWNYAQALPHLFPKLERTLREQVLLRSMNPAGHTMFRAALPDGPPQAMGHPAADGQLGGILKLYRDWQISGDDAWAKSLYPRAKRSIDFCINRWDPQRQGALFEPHHNTYDIEFWGPDGMCTSIYIGALCAIARLASGLGFDADATDYEALAERGAAYLDAELFNGEYYQQNVLWRELRDQSFARLIAVDTHENQEMLRLLRAEGPKYQYGSGCLSDGVIGAWFASFYGVETPMNRDRIRATLAAIFKHNFRADLTEHVCTQRTGYAVGEEAGLLLCTWPRGGQPTLPFPYSDEVWTGIEYQVAAHLIAEGMVDAGETIVRAVRSRYDGHVRNPFNEYECGNYYARALASYALLQAYSGFRYSAVEKTLWIAPRTTASSFTTFFSTATAFGTITLTDSTLRIDVVEGQLPIQRIIVGRDEAERTIDRALNATAEQAVVVPLE